MFFYHFLHFFGWFLRPWYYGARVAPTMKHMHVSFAVLHIAPRKASYKFTSISTYWTNLLAAGTVFKLFCVCHTKLNTIRTLCIDALERAPTVCISHLPVLSPLRDVTFFHFRPSVRRAALISFDILALTMVYFTKPSMPNGSFSTSETGAPSHIPGSNFLCLDCLRTLSGIHSSSVVSESVEEFLFVMGTDKIKLLFNFGKAITQMHSPRSFKNEQTNDKTKLALGLCKTFLFLFYFYQISSANRRLQGHSFSVFSVSHRLTQ